jgi:hypothetical protein
MKEVTRKKHRDKAKALESELAAWLQGLRVRVS